MPAMRGTEREGGDLERAHVEAHQIGHALVVMDCGNRDAKARRKQQPNQHRHTERKQRDGRQADVGRDRIAGRAADHLEIEDRRPHDLAQCKCGKRKINAARPQHGTATASPMRPAAAPPSGMASNGDMAMFVLRYAEK